MLLTYCFQFHSIDESKHYVTNQFHPEHYGLRSTVGNVTDCRSRGLELDPDLVPYFPGD